jgi:hypothetical protein
VLRQTDERKLISREKKKKTFVKRTSEKRNNSTIKYRLLFLMSLFFQILIQSKWLRAGGERIIEFNLFHKANEKQISRQYNNFIKIMAKKLMINSRRPFFRFEPTWCGWRWCHKYKFCYHLPNVNLRLKSILNFYFLVFPKRTKEKGHNRKICIQIYVLI